MLSLCITETLFSIDAYTSTTQLSVGSLDKINHCLQGVDARLAGVEDAISQLCKMMVHFTSILEAKEKGHYGKPEVPSCRPESKPESKRVQAVFDKQYYGSSSLTSFIGKICSSLQDFVADACMYDDSDRVGDGSLQECMAIMSGVANSLQMEQRLDNSTDGKSLVLPPKKLLDAAIGIYFDEINRMLPLFDRDTFHENVCRSYEPGQEAENAWILCFNGIILITLNTRALGSSNAVPDRENVQTDDSEKADFIKNFHANFKRGLNKPQSLLEPSLANVQALLLMVSRPLLMTLCDYYWLPYCAYFPGSAQLLKKISRPDSRRCFSIKLASWLSLLAFISKMRCRRSKLRAKRLRETMSFGLCMSLIK